jgi:hypothetical protein
LPLDAGADERRRSNAVDPDCKPSRRAMPERDIINAAKNAAGSGFIRKLTTIRRRLPRGNCVAALFDPDCQRQINEEFDGCFNRAGGGVGRPLRGESGVQGI